MAKILKHFGLGNKKSSPCHKDKCDVGSPKVQRSEKKEDANEPRNISPTQSTFAQQTTSDVDAPVYSAVIKDKITPDSILNEITLKLNVGDEKPESLSTFGKGAENDKKTPSNQKLPDVIKAESSSSSSVDRQQIEYDDPYEEGPIFKPLDSGMSSLKSSTTTLNHPGGAGEVDDDAPPSGDDDAANKCVGETQIGFDTLRSWSNDNTNTTTNTTTTTTTSNIDESSDTGTLEGPPPPLPAKTYNLPNHLPPPPPTLLNQPLDLSAKTPTDSHIDQSWRFSKYNEPSLPPGPPPEPPIRLGETANSYNRNTINTTNYNNNNSNYNYNYNNKNTNSSLMMRSAYGLDGQYNYQHPPQHYYHHQSPYSPHPGHYRSGSVRSIDYRHEYEEPWDHPNNFQTAPDGMKNPYSPHHTSRTSLFSTASSSYAPIDLHLPLQQQFWYHGTISRTLAEALLRPHREGAFLVRMSESNRTDLSLSVKSSRGYMHMKIVTNQDGRYILGQFSQPFGNIASMIHHYTLHKLPIKGAEHVSLTTPVPNDVM